VTTIITVSGGSTISQVVTTSALVAVTSGSSQSTGAPSLDANNGSSGSSGLSSSQKSVIIGVVVGVGGAILLGGLAFVAWRIWVRKRRSTTDDDDLMDSNRGSLGREKTGSVSGNSPFRATLDQYHNPAGPVNTASNF